MSDLKVGQSIQYRGYVIERRGALAKFPDLYEYAHEAYDGPGDPRRGWGNSLAECRDEIDEQIEEGGDAMKGTES